MGKKNKGKNRVGVMYSTDDNYDYEYEGDDEETLVPNEQKLYVLLDKKQRAGKKVTLIEGFVGEKEDLKDLGKALKNLCGVGGTAKNGEILIQGDFRDRIVDFLQKQCYNVKKKG
ncbi:MAG: translation initiation factor [Chitinophagales bacterium]